MQLPSQREQSDHRLYCLPFFENPTLVQFYFANYNSNCPLELSQNAHVRFMNKSVWNSFVIFFFMKFLAKTFADQFDKAFCFETAMK